MQQDLLRESEITGLIDTGAENEDVKIFFKMFFIHKYRPSITAFTI